MSSTGIAIYGSSTTGAGVFGNSSSASGLTGHSGSSHGVYGQSSASDRAAVAGLAYFQSTGVQGCSVFAAPLPPPKPKTGVYGIAVMDANSRGVIGESTSGQGVRGEATSGVGVYGTASSGFALRTSGRLKADKVSGVATIPAGATGVTISPGVNVTGGSFVLLTPKANIGSRGLWFTTNATANTFRIRMSNSRSSNTKVAWLLLG